MKLFKLQENEMAYAQWGTFIIHAVNFDITIKNITHAWGKLYDSKQIGIAGGNKDNEYGPGAVEGKVIKSGQSLAINACGREGASSGTEGSFDIYDGQIFVGTYSWECPWGSKKNSSTWNSAGSQPMFNRYITQQSGANLNGGALGTVIIQTAKLPS
ncbi:aegerolysin family protein [Pseudomonas cichorii]|uniref:aegerolysin family protein n=1 Tax=Pseudomonas cichorii TaxID=36746 RepID=UPI0019105DD4|nr:aegerolysin family protein [Pseudomonas cichorii]